MMMSFDSEIETLSKDLEAYEISAQGYLFGINPQRKMQVFILKKILIHAKLGLLSPEHACAMIFALMNSIQENARSFGFGSQLKSITTAFLDKLQLRDSLVKQTTAQVAAGPKVTLIEGLPANQHGIAGLSFLNNLALFTNTITDNPDIEKGVIEAAVHYSSTNELQFTIDPIMESVSDILLTEFTPLPLALVGDHLRYLYQIILDQIIASLPPNTTKAAETILLELLPADLRTNFQKFIDDENFITPQDMRLFTTSASEFATTYMVEKSIPEKLRGRASEEILGKKASQSKIDNLLKSAFLLINQFSPVDRMLCLADKGLTNFESLMSYVMALPLMLDLRNYDELSFKRQKFIERYSALQEKTIELTQKFLDLLNDYDLGDLPNPPNLFFLLNTFIKLPASKSKTQVIQALNAVNPISLRSLAEEINDHLANAASLKEEAKLFMNDSLAAFAHEQSEAYAQEHSQKIINQALQERLSSFLMIYLEELATTEALKLLPQIRADIKKRVTPIEKYEDPRLASEAIALKTAISNNVNALNTQLKGWATITIQNKSCGTIYRATADCQSLTATFEPLDIKIETTSSYDINALNNLIKDNPKNLGPAIIEYMRTGLRLEKQQVIELNEASDLFVSKCTTFPSLAEEFAVSCNKKLPIEDIDLPVQDALTQLLQNAANNYFERMLAKAPSNFEYAKAQTICKFQGIADIAFNKQGTYIAGVHLTYDPKQENPSTYLTKVRQQLNNNNRFFLSRWLYQSDTTNFIDDALKNAGGLRSANNTLLCSLTNIKPLTFANTSEIKQQASAQMARVFSPNIIETPSSASLNSASDPGVNDSIRSDHCLPLFPAMTLTARARIPIDCEL